jgi:hypothetical protein
MVTRGHDRPRTSGETRRAAAYARPVLPDRRRRIRALGAALVVGLAPLLLVAGCSAGSPAGSGPAAAPKVITVAYAGGTITPPPGKVPVPVGARVKITVTSDVADEVHNHVTDQELEVAAGGSVTFDFIADRPGVYEIELHHADKVLLQLQVG